MEDKWKMFKNYMHNELGITKEDVRQWIEDAVHEEAKRLVANEFNSFNVKKILLDTISDPKYLSSHHLKEDIKEAIAKEMMKHIKIGETINKS